MHGGSPTSKARQYLSRYTGKTVSHKFEYGPEQPVYLYYGPEKLDSMNDSILTGFKKNISTHNDTTA